MTPEILSAFVGLGISLLFKFVPVLDVWLYTKVTDDWRGLVMLGIVVLVTTGIYGLACAGFIDLVACTVVGLKELAWNLFLAVGTNKLIFLSTPDSKTKKALAS